MYEIDMSIAGSSYGVLVNWGISELVEKLNKKTKICQWLENLSTLN